MRNHAREWQSTFDAMHAAIWLLDDNHRILRTNKTAEQMFQLSKKKMIGKHCWEIVHGTKQPIPECPVLRAKSSLKRESVQLQINDKWFEVIVDPVLDTNGGYEKAVHTVTDITERKLMKERRERSEAILNATQQIAKAGGWQWDVKMQTMHWTDELYRIHGIDIAQFAPGSPAHIEFSLNCYDADDRPIVREAFGTCLEDGVPYDLELPFTKFTGERIWIRTKAKALYRGNQVEKIIGNHMDITERKLAEEKIRFQSERFRTFYRSVNDAIFVHPLKEEGFSPFIEVNEIACERYGYSYEEFLNLSPPDITKKTDADAHGTRSHRRQLLETGKIIFEAVHVKESGEEFPVEINSNIIYQQGTPIILAVVRDISERKRAEKEQEKLIQELQETLSKVKTLSGLLPICASCKKIRDDKGYWNQIEAYIRDHSEAEFSHGICPECSKTLYPDLDIYDD